jgi:hypothetical protein
MNEPILVETRPSGLEGRYVTSARVGELTSVKRWWSGPPEHAQAAEADALDAVLRAVNEKAKAE